MNDFQVHGGEPGYDFRPVSDAPPAQKKEAAEALDQLREPLLGKVKATEAPARKAEVAAATANQLFQGVDKALPPAQKPMSAHKVAPQSSWGASVQAAFSKLGTQIASAWRDAKMSFAYTFSLSSEQRQMVDALKGSPATKETFQFIQGKLEADLQVGKLQDLVENHMELLQHTCGAKFTQGLIAHLASSQAGRESQWIHSLATGLSKTTGADLSAVAEQVAHNPAIPEGQRMAVFAFRASEQLEQAGKPKNPLLQQLMDKSFSPMQQQILKEIQDLTARTAEFGEGAAMADFSAAKSGIHDEGVHEQTKLMIDQFDLVKNMIGEKRAERLMLQRIYLAHFEHEKGNLGAVKTVKEQLLKDHSSQQILEALNSDLGKERIVDTFTGPTGKRAQDAFLKGLGDEVVQEVSAKAKQVPWKTI